MLNFSFLSSLMTQLWTLILTFISYCQLMVKNYPKVCYTTMKQGFSDLIIHRKTPTMLFKEWNPLKFSRAAKYGHYACQIVFNSRFEDRARLNDLLVQLAGECGFPEELVKLEFDDSADPTSYNGQNSVQASNHYIFGDKKNWNFKRHSKRFQDYVVGIHAFESSANGVDTTVMWAYLPGKTWDGTSCFNFMKELVSRYHSGVANKNVTGADDILSMTNEAKQSLNDPIYILRYFLLLPFALFLNTSVTMWEKADAMHSPQRLKSSGEREMAFLNLSREESRKVINGFKSKGISPTAGLIYAASTAYKRYVGCYPFGINVQASLQTRAFTPIIKERYFIGDWLVGPCYKVRNAKNWLLSSLGLVSKEYFTPKEAQALYNELIHDVQTSSGAIRESFIAREYAVVKGGPAPYQNQPTYGDLNRMNDSILFNNYGPRTMHENARLVSWNWTGPGKLDVNTICVNGHTCVSVASTLMGIDHVTKIRDEIYKIITEELPSASTPILKKPL